uniref:Uncharacterized protein n=1 Tax=Pipistrellus kuhlii TaxID=59472 RepID=A0A7J7T368_PIPKU|nr:hypothetical protein mPipKuh1_009701 [Pipistrellus kuhlii]
MIPRWFHRGTSGGLSPRCPQKWPTHELPPPGFLPFLFHLLHSLTSASLGHLSNKPPVTKSLSWGLCSKNRNQTTTLGPAFSPSNLPRAPDQFLELKSFLELGKCYQILGNTSRNIYAFISLCIYKIHTQGNVHILYKCLGILPTDFHISPLHLLTSYPFTPYHGSKGAVSREGTRCCNTWPGQLTTPGRGSREGFLEEVAFKLRPELQEKHGSKREIGLFQEL